MENAFNTISLKRTYSEVASLFLYKSQSAILLGPEYLHLARKYSERSEKVGARFDNGGLRDQKSCEVISRDVEKLFHTISYAEPSNPILNDLNRTIETLDELAIEAFIRDGNTSSGIV